MKETIVLFYIIENKEIDVEKNISEVKKSYSELASEIRVIYCKDYLPQVLRVLQEFDSESVDKVIVMTNHLIGPIYPIQGIMDKMDKVSCDFWTLTKVGRNIAENVEEHFQFYFCVFNSSFFENENIRHRLKTNGHIKDEIEFTDLLTECGLHGEMYINTDELEKRTVNYRIDASVQIPYLLVKEYGFPYIRFEALDSDNKFNPEIQKLMYYLKEDSAYWADKVWEYILSSCNIVDIYSKFSLNYVLSKDYCAVYEQKYNDTALLVHLYYEDLVMECLNYIAPLASFIDVYISTGNAITYEKIQREVAGRNISIKEVRKIENRGRDVASLLYYCKDLWEKYEIFGFIHDKKSSGQYTVLQGDLFRYTMLENMVASKDYVCNIIGKLKDEERLGLVVPPIPKNDIYKSVFWSCWGDDYENVLELADRLDVHVPIDKTKPLIALSTCFWCKTTALDKLYKCRFDISEFDLKPFPLDGTLSHAIERILPFVAQDAGYYTASVETEDYSSLELAYYFGRMSEIKEYQDKYTEAVRPILGFVSRYKTIYIYGCGKVSNEVTSLLLYNRIEYAGYIVTNKETDVFCDKPVYSIDEINTSEDVGIIVAAGVKIKSEIEGLLSDKGFDYFLWRQ